MLTIFIFISSLTFHSKVLPFIELFLKTGSNFLLFCFYCSIVFIIIFHKKWGLEFFIKLFLKGGLTTALLPKTAIPGRVFPSGGTPMSSMSPHKIQKK